MPNMVDERFELAALIFRLAGHEEFGFRDTDYQRETERFFIKFENHEAIKYTRTLQFGYDAVFKFSVHITKDDGIFIFIDDILSLFDGRWNHENAERFLALFNEFYVDTDYGSFFDSHTEYFEQCTQRFIDEIYGRIDFGWFAKYVDTSNLRCIYSPSSDNFGATVNGRIIYCLVYDRGSSVIHEFCHSFANPIADRWYAENPEFRMWCDDSINSEKMPYYDAGWIMAREYVTRAYNILYEVQHGASLEEWLSKEKDFRFKNSFKYINEVYGMIIAGKFQKDGNMTHG